MEKKEDYIPEIFGVKEILFRKEGDYTIHYYEIDFKKCETPRFIEKYSCNLYADKSGDVRLKLSLYSQTYSMISLYYS